MDPKTPPRSTIALDTPPSSSSGSRLAPLETLSTSLALKPTERDALTPPVTPSRSSTDSSKIALLESSSNSFPNEPLPYEGDFMVIDVVGKGAWSMVSLAEEICLSEPVPRLPTPPGTPRSSIDTADHRIAIKTPAHGMAKRVLRREALTLTYLSQQPHADRHIVPFRGFHAPSGSLVLGYAPQTLLSYTSSSNASPPPARSDPLPGSKVFLQIARSLVASLAWLHALGYAHGDVKPSNILLLPSSNSNPAPVLADFSSTLPLSGSQASRDDALTTAYASPELLASYLKPGGGDTPTAAADVWALALTLLVLGTGEEPYAGATSELQRTAMVRTGDPMGLLGWKAASRSKREGVVWRVVEGALRKGVGAEAGNGNGKKARWSADEWLEVVEGICQEEGI